jgi:hypothetical protein
MDELGLFTKFHFGWGFQILLFAFNSVLGFGFYV